MTVSFVLLLSFCFIWGDLNLGVGVDFPGTHEFSQEDMGVNYTLEFDSEMGFEIFAEYISPLTKNTGFDFSAGFGASYLFYRGIDEGQDENDVDEGFGFIPLYGLIQMGTNSQSKTDFYAKAKLGYDIFTSNNNYFVDSDLSGGLFMGFGGGICNNDKYLIELSYQIFAGSISDPGYEDINVTQSHLSLLLGLKIK